MSEAPRTADNSLAQARHTDQVCLLFEAAWKTGQRPRIEDYLREMPEPGRSALLRELIPLEADYRRLAGETPRPEDYQRFPDLDTAWLARILAAPEPAASPGTPLPLESTGPGATAPTPGPGDSGRPAAAPVSIDSGRYQPLRFHARGALGEVHVALDAELHREVALKRIQPPRAADPDSRRRFLLEAEITGRLEHPGIVPVYGLVQDGDGQPCYAMRFIQGESLQEAIKRFHEADKPGRDPGERSLALRQLLSRFIAVCNAVAYAHSRGIVHRDLKPANVMLGKYGETLLVDWGLAKPVARREEARAGGEDTLAPTATGDGNGTAMGQAVGTPAYMSPEQAAGRWDLVGPASDIYGLGATLYAMLTGQPPFKGEPGVLAPGALLERVKRGEFPRPRHRKAAVAPALEAVCLKAMARKPEDRYGTALELASEVEHWLADEPVAAYPEPWTIRARRWVKRRRTLVAGLAALVLATLLLGGGGWLWLVQKRAETRQEVNELLQEAALLWEQAKAAPPGDLSKWTAALAAAKRAEGRLAGDQGDEELQRRVDTMVAELEQEAKDRRMLARLENIRLEQPEVRNDSYFFYSEGTDLAFAQAFRDYGIDVERLEPGEAAARIRARPIKEQLAAALDDWASVKRRGKGRKRLFAIAQAADTDEWRNKLRTLLVRDVLPLKALEEMARSRKAVNLPPPTLYLLARILGDAGNRPAAIQLLRQAQQRHPGDFWINYELAWSLQYRKRPQLDEAIRFYTAALALRSQYPGVHLTYGTALQDKGQLDQAIAAYREAIRLKKDYALAYSNLGTALARKGELDQAIAAFREAIHIKKDFALAHFNLANAFTEKEQLDQAITEYQEAIRLKKDDIKPHIGLGNALRQKGQLDQAIAAYRKAIHLEKDYGPAHDSLGRALRQKGKLDQALAAFREAIRLNSDDAEAHNSLGALLCDDKRDYDGAIAAFRQAIRLKKDYPEAHNNLGIALRHKGQLDQALAAFREATRLKKDYAEAHNSLGALLCDHKRDYEGAIAALRQAIDVKKDYREAHFNLGMALYKKGRLDPAINAFRKAIRLNKDDFKAHLGLGTALVQKGHLDRALAAYQKAIYVKKDYAPAHYSLGRALRQKGQLEQAIVAFREAIRHKKDFAEAYNSLGALLCDDKRDYDGAIAAFRQAIRVKKDYPEAHIGLGNALAKKGRLDEAIAAYQQAIRLKKDYVEAHYYLGIALRQKGELDQAIAAYRKAIHLKKDYVEAHYNLGNAFRTKGQWDEAIRSYREVIRLQKDYAEAHCNLGHTLRDQGKFAEALDALKRGHRLGSRNPRWRYPSGQWVQQCERLVELDAKLPAILKEKAKPADVPEQLGLAFLCQQYKKRYAAAARFYADAFAAEPEHAKDLHYRHRYNAACAAALAAAGRGEDAGKLTTEERTRWRKQALDWLRSDLGLWTKQLDRNIPQLRAFVRQLLHNWQRDPDLAGVRDEEELVWLVAEERKACRQLWVDVEELRKRSQAK
jgi:tetratricopeptide (TPR) repeat protein/tRNA A-37 threonylcarbamoyl transferase component Bud32